MSDATQLNDALTGRYRVDREIGAGGMATVYLAHDVRHDRQVALKVLRPELSAILGADRFLKEIRTTANLQHPHILPLHDSGEAGGLVFYVMPFVEGESLRQRLTRDKQLPIDEAVRIAKEVASALDYAHRRGVVHRDIKPENILLHDGQALVADFGIALAVSTVGGGTRMTETGMSLGTPHYMSPEQAMGEREITPRSDVYALGCVLYEMLLGEPPFTGPTAQAIIARVVTEEPRSLTAQRKTIPPHVEAAIRTALAKLPADRFATAAEFASALSTTGYTGAMQAYAGAAPARSAGSWISDKRTIVTLVVGALLVAAAALWPRRGVARSDAAVTRLTVVPADSTLGLANSRTLHGAPVVSPDGRTIAFSVSRIDTTALFVQPLDRFEQWEVAGGGRLPFFSHDGRWIGFVRGSSIWKVPVGGGEPARIGTLDQQPWYISRGVWHPDGNIYFATVGGIASLPASGGTARMPRASDSTGVDRVFELTLMPDGRLMGTGSRLSASRVVVIKAGENVGKPLPEDIRGPAWFVGDVFVFTREGQFYAGMLDLDRLELRGEPIAITDLPPGVLAADGSTAAWFDAAAGRRLELVWVSRTGQVTPTGLPIADYRWPRLSPDGTRIATWPGTGGIHVLSVTTGAPLRLYGPDGKPGRSTEPVWFSDGKKLLMSGATRSERIGLVTQVADGSHFPDTVLAPTPTEKWPTDISSGDSLALYYGAADGDGEGDVYAVNLRTKAVRRIELPGSQRGARFSPDGRWIAIESREAARDEVIVLPWPKLDAKYLVSADGGDHPVWSRDGRELFFRKADKVMSVRVGAGAAWTAPPPVELFHGPFARDIWGDQSFDVAADGRFLMLRFGSGARVQVRVIQNWEAELKRKIAEAQR